MYFIIVGQKSMAQFPYVPAKRWTLTDLNQRYVWRHNEGVCAFDELDITLWNHAP